MQRLEIHDGSLERFLESWKTECLRHGEDFIDYAPFVLKGIEEQCESYAGEEQTGIFALPDGQGGFDAVCYITGVFIPGYEGRVLRVREILLRPKYDFEDTEPEIYAAVLQNLIRQSVQISESEIACDHIKFHFRSPQETQLVDSFAAKLNEVLEGYGQSPWSAKRIGAWLYIDKKERKTTRIKGQEQAHV